ncbi:MAG: hypothetical protein ACOY0S_00230 [Patescibacteria group bacterium]
MTLETKLITPAELGMQLFIASWKPDEAKTIYKILEHPNWAPWLEASAETLAGRAMVFPKGQLVMKDLAGHYIASLSMNQIQWNGDIKHLPSWDNVAGDPTDYSTTYKPDGNALVLMSMNVAPEYKGKQIPSKMIAHATLIAKQLGIEHFLGSFRPSGYGLVKKGMGHDFDFEEYCMMKRHNSTKPVDPWLGSLWHVGMEMLAVDDRAMTVKVSLDEFWQYQKTYKPEVWVEVAPGVWECEEVGSWTVDLESGIATYIESNVWGSLPLPKYA